MTTYLTASLTTTDPSRMEAYGPAVHELVGKHGGRYIAPRPEVTKLEGDADAPSAAVIIEFPDRASAEAWYNDAEYQPWLASRNSGSNGPVLMIDGL